MIDALSVLQTPNPDKPSRGGQVEIKNPKHAQDIEKRTYQNYS